MADYYTATCFEIPNVSPMEASWFRAMLADIEGVFDDGEFLEDKDEETQALWAQIEQCGYLALPYALYDEPRRVLTICGEDISIDVLNIVLKAFLKRWNRVDTIEYTWSHRSDNCEEVGEFYGGAESVCAQRTRAGIVDEIAKLFYEEFGSSVSGRYTTETGHTVSYDNGVLRVATLTSVALLADAPSADSKEYLPAFLELWKGLTESRKQREQGADVAQRVLDDLHTLRAKKAGK
jgi:hypothetical protein